MGFTSSIFIFAFFPICIGLFYLLYSLEKKCSFFVKYRLKDIYLICISLSFYWWGMGSKGILFLICYIVFIYFVSRIFIKNSRSIWKKRTVVVAIAIAILSTVLFYYKYANFVTTVVSNTTGIDYIIQVSWVPLGISFITFSAISYLMDVYREDSECGTLIDAALYLILFTKVISGPIALWKDFQPQIKYRKISVDSVLSGLNRIMIGFAKKLILADYFGTVIMEIQKQAAYGIDVPTAWGCAVLYTLQIYYDFAGYSDIALGLSKLFGIELKENFAFPYTASSITEFWRKWHISLGTWFKEYLYIPLGGNRKGKKRTLINLGIVFFITGVWHGAGWNYLFWGMLHGSCIIVERGIKNTQLYIKIPKFFKWLFTVFIVTIGWEAFRIQGFHNLLAFYKLMFGIGSQGEVFLTWEYFFGTKVMVFALIGIAGAVVLKWRGFEKMKLLIEHSAGGVVVQELALLLLMIISIICMISSTYSPFIYFQY